MDRRRGLDGILRLSHAHLTLIVVCVTYCAAIALRTSQSMPLLFDESVYASQNARGVPAAMFSAPRARGMSWLLAPVSLINPSATAIRVYLTLLAGVSMYLAYRPWLAVMRRVGGRYEYVPAVAAFCFGSLWVTTLYGTMAYPNLWLAFALVAGVGYGCLLPGAGRHARGVAVAFAVGSLLRPTDALAAAAGMLGAVVLARRRPLQFLVAVVSGLAVGWGAWLLESERFGGPVARLRSGAETNESGLVFSLGKVLRAADGPALLCRPDRLCAGGAAVTVLWFVLVPAVVTLGVLAARRSGWFDEAVSAIAAGVILALPYVFLIGYAAARFLLPAYALLAIPVAGAVVWGTGPGRGRVPRLVTVSLLVTGHVVAQQLVLGVVDGRLHRSAASAEAGAALLRTEQGVRPPCLIVGESAIQLGFQLGCRSEWIPDRPPESDDRRIAAALRRSATVVVRVKRGTGMPPSMSRWRHIDLPPDGRFIAYLSP